MVDEEKKHKIIVNFPRWTWSFLPAKTRRALVIASIRDHMLFFGYDLSTVTDEKFEENIITAARLITKAMPTVKEVTEACQQLGRVAAGLKADILLGPGGDPQSGEPLT